MCKPIVKIIKKRIKDNPRRWHEKLSEAMWAHRTSRHGATRVSHPVLRPKPDAHRMYAQDQVVIHTVRM
jgi:hypothetical protein